MKRNKLQKNKGFTLIETLVAIIILALTLNALFTLISSSIFSAKYARNEITATYLAQEVIDYLRNDRDTIAFQKYGSGTWDSFLLKYGYLNGTSDQRCFFSGGCTFDVTDVDLSENDFITCANSNNTCAPLRYNSNPSAGSGYYTYNSSYPETSFKRIILMKKSILNPDEINVTVKVIWKNGSNEHSRVLTTSLLKWR